VFLSQSGHRIRAATVAHVTLIAISLENGNAPVIAEGRVELVDGPHLPEVLAEFVRKHQWDLNGDDAATHSMFSTTPTKWIHWNA
jgi:hypothetical protein